jgi:hypothetical protein
MQSRTLIALLFVISLSGQTLPSSARLPASLRRPGASSGGGGGAYLHSHQITTDATQAGTADSTNFPITVSLNSGIANIGTTLKTVANGGHIQNTVTQVGGVGGTEPADAVFGTTSSCTTMVPWETEFYDPVAGTWIVHVNNGTLSHTVNNVFFLCYDAAAVTTQQNVGSFSPANVWSNAGYTGVYHLPNGTTLSGLDSLGSNNGTLLNAPTAAAGQIDGAASFAGGSSQGITISSALSVSGTKTLTGWVNVVSISPAQFFWSFDGSVSNDGFAVFIESGVVIAVSAGSFASGKQASSGWTDNTWHYVVVEKTTAQINKIYLDGVDLTAADATDFVGNTTAGNAIAIGAGGGGLPFTGLVDETRLFNGTLSLSWITAEFNCQKTSSTFLTIGPEI